ncbi:MAG TPA: hypothetical protein PLD49_03330 [Thermoclostridium caenicola]|uniref:Uncharacterized protein n=1 Tax=Thermoclostridium caenicola TaxID=659425 RepID=A0A1M6EV94_9FIRM|nr:hypothetical protein [Thermoclostridium caenicola]SHI89407.1 hypothetical protein SAMN05444373_10146 [Thermoclostridium caenicola]HOK42677.1 hypothetical protein [Thermoclostridium caenicola]HOL83874.1 hypothetical protein [Thermoclostridium caenicola]HOP72938.1 hypothetical protein [Thermoclostridium caenicola]HPO75725.1 hypothetical protein [Thermoclostridium caenicola]
MNDLKEQILVLQLLLLQQQILQLAFIKGLVRDELVRLYFKEQNEQDAQSEGNN